MNSPDFRSMADQELLDFYWTEADVPPQLSMELAKRLEKLLNANLDDFEIPPFLRKQAE